ncbi:PENTATRICOPEPTIDE REPEAT-CONTAINING PROTEIN [Salix purpurea]|uniref:PENTATRICOPEPTIDE REPEAT-CONTAINING PROTEIN n=1 Tax=Salix purpurea TaxID=77065 RepID=A0A9Q0VIE5_SALPP|nr:PENTATRICOPEPTIDE REPEAT-CONTAINING PROTEIN [Salix purpurea]
MIRAYANVGQCFETFKLYSFMRKTNTFVNNCTYPFVFKACALNLLVREGKVVHGDSLKNWFGSDLYVAASLVDMYAKCDLFVGCHKIFDKMFKNDLVCWTAMITAYEQAEKPEEALILFKKMQQEEGLLAASKDNL